MSGLPREGQPTRQWPGFFKRRQGCMLVIWSPLWRSCLPKSTLAAHAPKTVHLKASLLFLQVLIQRIFLLWNNLTICTFVVLKLEPTSLANSCRLEAKVFLTFATGSAANPAKVEYRDSIKLEGPTKITIAGKL